MDCYGEPAVIGKVGTDIQDNKCGWLVIKALERATPAQREILELNYGQHDDAKIAAVKALYLEMDLESVFKEYEENSYAEMQKLIGAVTNMPRGVFEFLLQKIYKRKL